VTDSERPRIAPLPRATVSRVVALALEEDLGRGDVTTSACVPPGTRGAADFLAREPLVLAGVEIVRAVYAQVDPEVEVRAVRADGDRLAKGDVGLSVSGPAAAILSGERVALNLLQRTSGVATLARRFVDALPAGSKMRITDTRKTTPGLRALERWAVRVGGAHNHREDLSAAVLIKDNHIAAAGGLAEAVARARARAPHTCRIEVEVDSLALLDEALGAGADVIMLDNFDDAALPGAVSRIGGRAIVEVSGRVTLERVARIAAAGVDVASVGALTHSAPAVDIGLDWKT